MSRISLSDADRDSGPRAAGPCYAPLRGRPPAPPAGVTPPLRGPGSRPPRDLGRGHRAPPRGVDVKATPAEGSRGSPRGLKTAEIGENRQNPRKWPFSAFFGVLGLFGPFLRFRDSRQGGFYINPSRRGPVPAFSGFSGPRPEKVRVGPFWAFFPRNPRKGGFPGFRPLRAQTARSGDRAPARGVDVKPPSPGRPVRGTPASRAREGHIPDPGDREPCWEPWRPLPGPWKPLPAAPRGLLLHQPLAAGPCGPSGTQEVAPGPCPRHWRLVAPTPAPYRGGGTGRRVRGGLARRAAWV